MSLAKQYEQCFGDNPSEWMKDYALADALRAIDRLTRELAELRIATAHVARPVIPCPQCDGTGSRITGDPATDGDDAWERCTSCDGRGIVARAVV